MRRDLGPILAVRGPRTRDALSLPADLPLGDPGLLVSRQAARAARPEGMVVIPHFTQWNTPIGRRQIAEAMRAGFDVVEPSLSPRHVLRRIAQAAFVGSASLHGVVLAHALGVPAQLVRDTGTREPLWKYEDYFASLDLVCTWSAWEDLARPAELTDLVELRRAQAAEIADRAAQLGENLVVALRGWLRSYKDAPPALMEV